MKSIKKFEHALIIVFLMIFSVYLSSQAYPFIGTADGFKRLLLATLNQHGMAEGFKTLWVATHIDSAFSVLPPLQSYFFHIFLITTGEIWHYTITQTFFFYLSTYLAAKFIFKDRLISIALIIALLFFPVFSIFPLILTDSAMVYIVIALFPITIITCKESIVVKKYLSYLLLLFITTTIFGFRFNSITVLPIMLLAIYVYHKEKFYLPLLIVMLSLFFTSIINHDVRKENRPEALGMAWELVALAKHDASNTDLGHELNFCGNTEKAISVFDPMALNSIFWSADAPIPVKCIVSVNGSDRVKDLYKSAWKNHFNDMLILKLNIWNKLFGISQPLLSIDHGLHSVDSYTLQWGAIDNENNTKIRSLFINSGNDTQNITLRPIFSFLLLALSLVLIFIYIKKSFLPAVIMSLFSLSYYCGFMISAQSMEFRYFAPSFFTNTVITVGTIVFMTLLVVKKLHIIFASRIKAG